MESLERLASLAPFDLWLVDLSVDPAHQAREWLSEQECDRAARFVFARDRRHYEAAHCALRGVLAGRTGVAAKELRFAEGAFGKPRLVTGRPVAFSLSHSDGVGLIALANEGEIGVDVECLRPIHDARELALQNFAPGEIETLACAPSEQRSLAFLRGWTRKEACLKAVGSGLSIAPHTFDAGLMARPTIVEIANGAGSWRVEVQSIDVGATLVAAVARVLTR
jgi:4'-phosphopantetheinyl transferase